MKIKVIGLGKQGIEEIRKAYIKVEKGLRFVGEFKSSSSRDDYDSFTSCITNCYFAGNCLIENMLILGTYHSIKIAGKVEDVDEILGDKPDFLMTYRTNFEHFYEVGETNLDDFDSISDLEKAVS